MIQEPAEPEVRASVHPQEPNVEPSPAAKDHAPLLMRLTLIFLSAIALFYSLGDRLLRTWDESIYAEIAKEMALRHSWLTPHWNYQPWFEKPPLFMWLTAIMFRLFGVSELSARAVGALCGIATIWLTFEIGRRLMDDRGGFAAAIILMTNGNFILVSRFGAIDVPLAFCITLAAYAYLRVEQEDSRWWYLAGAATGVAIMLKGVAGLAAPLALCLALLLDRRLTVTIRSREFRNSSLVACAIALPWHLAMLIVHGRAFLHEYIGYHVLARMRGFEGMERPPHFYLWAYWHDFAPFAIAALFGLLLHLKEVRKSSIVVSIPLVITIGYSLSASKLLAYCIPAFPFICLLSIMAIRRVFKHVEYAIVCAAILFPLYWYAQKEFVELDYSDMVSYVGSLNSKDEAMMLLLAQIRPRDHDDHDPASAPLIVCVDRLPMYKQQSVFYSDRRVIEAFLVAPPNAPEADSPKEVRYSGPAPLEQVVGSRPTLIIVHRDLCPELAYSGKYNFIVMAQSGPLILGQISRT